MRTKITFLTALFLSVLCYSQSIERFSVDSGGANSTAGDIQILYTIGEVNVAERTSASVSLSEGFINFSFTTTLSIEDKNALAFRVFPNPVTNYFTVDAVMNINSIELYNILGEQVLQTKRTQNIPVSLLEDGVYLIIILTDNGTITKRIIKR